VGEVGLLLPSREVLLWRDGDLGFLVRAAVEAEEAGYDSVWVGDSLLARPRGEPLTLLAAVAGATSRVRLGTAVLLPLLRHPLLLAHQLATVDRIAEGRLIAGVGPGNELPGTHAELKAVGVRSDHRVGDLLAELEAIRRVWSGDGEIKLEPRPLRPQGPPIWLGAHGPRMLRATGQHFDGWLPLPPTPEIYASSLRAVREAAEQAGRDPGSIVAGVYLTIAVADDAATAQTDLDAYIRGYYGVPAEVMARGMAMHAGTPESARAWFKAYRDAGASHVVVRLARPRLDGYGAAAKELLASAR
jgi:alkanesulfonate monooxygenase SsuD/methylene tetrahydromethanopterin reductase-like flavin-dependent oxidoreductase (luciferase family)